mgnify:CR=1 FL=1
MVNTNVLKSIDKAKSFVPEKFRPKSIPDNYQELIDSYVSALDAVVRSANLGIYIVDVFSGICVYASENIENICGINPMNMVGLGGSVIEMSVPEDDLLKIQDVIDAAFLFFDSQREEEKLKYTCFHSFAFGIGKRRQFRMHRSTPLALSPDGKIWLILCVVSLAHKGKENFAVVRKAGLLDEEYVYNYETRRWLKRTKISISEFDREILRLSKSGYSVKEIAGKLLVSNDTVKAHKKKIFEEFGVSTITEALAFAEHHKLL